MEFDQAYWKKVANQRAAVLATVNSFSIGVDDKSIQGVADTRTLRDNLENVIMAELEHRGIPFGGDERRSGFDVGNVLLLLPNVVPVFQDKTTTVGYFIAPQLVVSTMMSPWLDPSITALADFWSRTFTTACMSIDPEILFKAILEAVENLMQALFADMDAAKAARV